MGDPIEVHPTKNIPKVEQLDGPNPHPLALQHMPVILLDRIEYVTSALEWPMTAELD